eukprot:702974-Amphidinium_carterae.1
MLGFKLHDKGPSRCEFAEGLVTRIGCFGLHGIAAHRLLHTLDNRACIFDLQESVKCEHLGAEAACRRQGFGFVPSVALFIERMRGLWQG